MKRSDKIFIPVVECVISAGTDGLMECVEADCVEADCVEAECVVCVECETVMAGSSERMETVHF